MEHLLLRSKWSIFHYILKTNEMIVVVFFFLGGGGRGRNIRNFELFIENDAMF